MLLEAMIAIALLAIGILGFMSSFVSTVKASDDATQQDEVRVALENMVEFLRSLEFDMLYTNLNGAYLEVPSLRGENGYSAYAVVDFFVNEHKLPAEFGPVLDLDGDPAKQVLDCSATYEMLPTRITLRYLANGGPMQKTLYMLLVPDN
jgi:hypothetical protein